MEQQINIHSRWALDPLDGTGMIFSLQLDHPAPAGTIMTDITGTPGSQLVNDPNDVVIQVIGEDTYIDSVLADPNYTEQPSTRSAPGAEDPTLDDEMSQAEYSQYRTAVLAMLNPANGKKPWNAGQWNKALGPNPDGRTKREVNTQIVSWIQSTVKADPLVGYTIGAQNQSDNWVGFRKDGTGTIDPVLYREMEFEFAEEGTGPNNRVFRLKMAVVGPTVDVDFFGELVIWDDDGTIMDTLRTDATENFDYDPAAQLWTWTNTSVNFLNGKLYPMEIVAVIPPAEEPVAMTITLSKGNVVATWTGDSET